MNPRIRPSTGQPRRRAWRGWAPAASYFLVVTVLATPPVAHADPVFHVRKVRGPLREPTWVGSPAGDRRLFATERRGIVVVWHGGRRKVLLDIRSRVSTRGAEQGLLSVAFHADFATNGRFWVYYTNRNGKGRVYQFRARGDRTITSSSRRIIGIDLGDGATNHNGGHLAYGPDGNLYLSIGDGGGTGDQGNNAQDRKRLRGKLLRINVDSGYPYTIPASNPYAGSGDFRREIFALGLRNPWRFDIDPPTGDIYIADVGQARREEVNRLRTGLPIGANLGWRRFEGSLRYANTPLAAGTTHSPPVVEYSHGPTQCSITGGVVYHGSRIPALQGHYIYADYCGTWIRGFKGSGYSRFRRDVHVPGIVSFGRGPGNEVYFVSIANGNVYRIVP